MVKKPVLRINANLVNHSGPVIDCKINNMQTQACIDSGSTFTIQPYAFFKTLNISESRLNKSISYTIDSASHHNENAVFGSILLNVLVQISDGSMETFRQKFLILKPELKLKIILFGNDFLYSNNGKIEYCQMSRKVKVNLN